jgi:glycosyltransferase involved in cell wall biosynthesis
MNVALIEPFYPPARREGGIAHYTQCLARALATAGHPVRVLTSDEHLSEPRADAPPAGVAVEVFPHPWTRATARKMAAHLRQSGAEFVLLQYSPASYSTAFKLAWPLIRGPFKKAVSFHTLWGGKRINQLIALLLLHGSDFTIATNSEIVFLLHKYLPRGLKQNYHIPIGPNIEPAPVAAATIAALRQRLGLRDNAIFFAYFGMVYAGKGLRLLIETAQVAAQQASPDFQLLLIGGGISDDPQAQSELEQWIAQAKLDWHVIRTGQLPAAEVSALLQLSAAVILPFESGVSDRRGSLMAALAHGKAIVTTPPCVPIPFFINGGNMVWPEKPTPEALAELLRKICADPARRRALEAGAARLARSFAWPRIAADHVTVFEAIGRMTRCSINSNN